MASALPDVRERETESLRELTPNPAFKILLLGDFSGASTGSLLRIDRDNFDNALDSFAPRIELALGNGQLGDTELEFRSLEHFEPDHIYLRAEIFAALRQDSQALYSEPDESAAQAQLSPTREQIERLTSPGGLLEAIVEKSSSRGGAPPKQIDEFQSMVERIVAPYTSPSENAETRQASAERRQRAALLMSHILHNQEFQALESAWRGLDSLVRNLDTDERIHLYIFDISKEGLNLDVPALPGRWGMLAGNFGFDRSDIRDVELLERIGSLARSVGGPFIAECLPSQQENAKAEAAWLALRKSPAAEYIGLALPRFLLRLPYGKETASVEAFEFEEMPGEPVHTDYLWANPVFACVLALGQMLGHPIPANLRLDGFPVHVFKVNGETVARPCTEILLSDRDCETLLQDGILPLAAEKGTDAIRFPKMASISDPPKVLAINEFNEKTA